MTLRDFSVYIHFLFFAVPFPVRGVCTILEDVLRPGKESSTKRTQHEGVGLTTGSSGYIY